MSDPSIMPMIGGAFFAVGGGVFLCCAFFSRYRLLPVEHGEQSLSTVFPLTVHCRGWRYSGPFSRVSLYADFLVVKAFGVSRVLKRRNLAASPEIHGNWLVLEVVDGGSHSSIKIATDNNPGLRDKLCAWLKGEGIS